MKPLSMNQLVLLDEAAPASYLSFRNSFESLPFGSLHQKGKDMATLKVDNSNFKSEVLDSDLPVVVDFWAEWCGPCKAIGPALEEISNEMGDKVKITKVNSDENPEIAAQYGVRSIPTLILFKNGEPAALQVGAKPKNGLVTWINGAI